MLNPMHVYRNPFDFPHKEFRYCITFVFIQGIGENIRGFSNGLIFVIFDRRICVRFIRCIKRLSCSPMRKLCDNSKDPNTKRNNCIRFIRCIKGHICFCFIGYIIMCILCCCQRKRHDTNLHNNNVTISSDDDNEFLDDSHHSLYSGVQASAVNVQCHVDRQKTFDESEKEVSFVFMDLSQSYGSISDEQELHK